MENYKDLYNSINNPLDDDAVINGIITAYANDSTMYSQLTKVRSDKKKYVGRYGPLEVRDELYAKLFKIWKENVLSLTDEEVNSLIKSSSNVEQDYHQLRAYLRTIPEIKTKDEYDLIRNDKNGLVCKYDWKTFGEYSGFIQIHSRYLTARKGPSLNKIKHRLYLNTESVDTETIASLFVDKCMEKKIPFYFKYDEYGDRDDTLVIYSDTEHLGQYITILREIKKGLEKENPNLVSRLHEPTILTGKIDGWIGYGSEPQQLLNGNRKSFNSLRAKAIEKAVDSVFCNWMYDHKNDFVNCNGKRMTLTKYLSAKVTHKIVENYKEAITKSVAEGTKSLDRLRSFYGLIPDDLTNGNLREDIIEPYIKQRVEDMMSNKKTYTSAIQLPTQDGRKIEIYGYGCSYLGDAYREFINQIAKNDPNFKQAIKDAIIKESSALGIDTEKYCFDISVRDELLSYQEPVKTQQENLTNDTTKNTVRNDVVQNANPETNKKDAAQRPVLSKEDQELAEYFRMKSLRDKRKLSIGELNRVKELAENNEKVAILEEAKRRVDDGKLPKEKYDKLNDAYKKELIDATKTANLKENKEKTQPKEKNNARSNNTAEQNVTNNVQIDTSSIKKISIINKSNNDTKKAELKSVVIFRNDGEPIVEEYDRNKHLSYIIDIIEQSGFDVFNGGFKKSIKKGLISVLSSADEKRMQELKEEILQEQMECLVKQSGQVQENENKKNINSKNEKVKKLTLPTKKAIGKSNSNAVA